jgi:hypothetical protein
MILKPTIALGSLVDHTHFGIGRVVAYDGEFYVVQFKAESRNVPFAYQEMKLVEGSADPEMQKIKAAVAEVLGDYGWIESNLELGKRWLGGTVRILPGKEDTQVKEIPIEVFAKKLIGVREKLRVLEQKINNHPALDAADKLDLQGYITRCYGSLTTFNVLFAEKSSQFSGSSSE